MARWRNRERGRIEPPGWYRTFDPAAWDEPDGQEWQMIAGCGGAELGPWLHEHHARRRWEAAKHAYRKDHPPFATQEFEDLIARRGKRLRGLPGNGVNQWDN